MFAYGRENAIIIVDCSGTAGHYKKPAMQDSDTASGGQEVKELRHMKLMTKRIAPLAVLAAVICCASLAGLAVAEENTSSAKGEKAAPALPAKPAEPKAEAVKTSPADPMVKVNGAVITRGEMERALKVLLAQNQQQGQNLPPALMKQAETATLDRLVAAELLYQEGAKREIKDLDKQVEEKFAQNKSRYGADFEKALKSADMTEKDLVEYTRKDLVINNLIQAEVASKVTITDEDAKKFYDDNIERFKQEEGVRASHILIGVDQKASAEEKQKAREKAETVLKKLKDGADFGELAKKESTCPSSAQGGDLGFFTKGQMVPAFEAAAYALKPGELSGVVETQFGYHIIKTTEKKAAETTKLDAVQEKIKDYLKGQKMQKAVSDYVAGLKEKAKIEKLEK
jgi:peptidyl-prolyl cis-trans isomerase C